MGGTTATRAADSPDVEVPPLFPVALDFEFVDPQATFDEVRELLLGKYYTGSLDEDALYLAAIKGMLRHVSPPRAPLQGRIWTAEEYQRVLDNLRGKKASLGIRSRFDPNDGSLTVTAVTPDSPADGVLQVHDRIMRIAGATLAGLDTATVDRRLNAPEGGTARLTVVRDIEVLTVTISPQTHDVPIIESGMLEGDVGYVRVRRITTGVAARVREAIDALVEDGAGRLVLDVRNNGGGVFIEGLRLAEIFVPSRTVLVQTLREASGVQRFVSGNPAPIELRVVVLANRQTASAAEAMIAAMVSAGRAQFVGTRTYGKASMDQTFTLGNEMRVRFIVGAMYAPNGQSWHERGIRPQFEVEGDNKAVTAWLELPLAQRLTSDRQLRSAWELVRRQ